MHGPIGDSGPMALVDECRALGADRAQHAAFEDKQKLMRMVLDKVVVKDWRVDVHYNIPLSRPAASREEKVSTNFDLCNARHHPGEIFGDGQITARQLLQRSQTMLSVIDRLESCSDTTVPPACGHRSDNSCCH